MQLLDHSCRSERLITFLLGKGAKRTWRTPKQAPTRPVGPENQAAEETATEMNTVPSDTAAEEVGATAEVAAAAAEANTGAGSIFQVEEDGGFTFGT